MSDIVIHNIHVSYDEIDERVRNFVKYLQNEGRKEEVKNYYEKARTNGSNLVFISDKFCNEFTFRYIEGHNCTLGVRGSGYND